MQADRLILSATGDWAERAQLLRQIGARARLTKVPSRAQVVLLATDAEELPADTVASVREHTQAPILLLAAKGSPRLIEEAIRADVADVLLMPQEADAIVFAAEKALRSASVQDDRSERGRVITVFSPKGGTGKSVTASNIAAALNTRGLRTLLLDLDVQFGDAAIILGLEPERTLHDVVVAPGALDAEKLTAFATVHASGLHVLPAPLCPEDAELISGEKIGEVLATAEAAYDAVVVDTPPFFAEQVLAALDHTDELVLVLAPDVPTLKNARLALQTLELLSFPDERIRVVLNRTSPRIGFGASDVAHVLDRGVDFELPEDPVVPIGVNRGIPAVLHRPSSAYAAGIDEMACRVVQGVPSPAPAPRSRRLPFARLAR
ncbi:MAG: AAA family ATPase [Actinobacteria bacterium]|nr:AAA family ATPase [Actinomycetota bacterium]